MKKNIVVCCEEMLLALCHGYIIFTEGSLYLRSDTASPTSFFKACPWCRKELHFPYEEEV